MQLKLRRYTGVKKGILSSKTTYCLEAMLLPSPLEAERINAFERWSDNISILGDLDLDVDDEEYKTQAMNVTIQKLAHGARFEYLNFNGVIRTENLIMVACKQLLATINSLATFDGSERVVEVNEDTAAVVARG